MAAKLHMKRLVELEYRGITVKVQIVDALDHTNFIMAAIVKSACVGKELTLMSWEREVLPVEALPRTSFDEALLRAYQAPRALLSQILRDAQMVTLEDIVLTTERKMNLLVAQDFTFALELAAMKKIATELAPSMLRASTMSALPSASVPCSLERALAQVQAVRDQGLWQQTLPSDRSVVELAESILSNMLQGKPPPSEASCSSFERDILKRFLPPTRQRSNFTSFGFPPKTGVCKNF